MSRRHEIWKTGASHARSAGAQSSSDRGQLASTSLGGRRPRSPATWRARAAARCPLDVLGDDRGPRGRCRKSAMSIPRSRAIRRASGEALTRPSVPLRRRRDVLGGGRRRLLSASWRRPGQPSRAGLDLLGACRPSGSATSPRLADVRDRRLPDPARPPRRDPQQDARGIGLDLLRHLLGVDLVERLALRDLVSLGLQPADDRRGLHPLAEPGELDLSRHRIPTVRCRSAASTSESRAGRRTPPSPARTRAA